MIRLIFFLLSTILFSQVGIGTDFPHPDSDLHLSEPNKTLILNRVDDLNIIKNPEEGMIVYDNSEGCVKGYSENTWTSCFSSTTTSYFFHVNGIGFKGTYKSETKLSNALFEITLTNNSTKPVTLGFDVNDLKINLTNVNVSGVYETGNTNTTTTEVDIIFLPKVPKTITYKLNGQLTSSDTSIIGIWKKIALSYNDVKEITIN